MKKIIDKSLIFQILGVVALAVELVMVSGALEQLDIIKYLLMIGVIPAAILFVTSLLYSVKTKAAPKYTYITACVMALIFSAIMLVYCGMAITPELVETILDNTVTTEGMQVSMTQASAGDNIQSVLVFVACSAIGVFVGNSIRKKSSKKTAVIENEYDD